MYSKGTTPIGIYIYIYTSVEIKYFLSVAEGIRKIPSRFFTYVVLLCNSNFLFMSLKTETKTHTIGRLSIRILRALRQSLKFPECSSRAFRIVAVPRNIKTMPLRRRYIYIYIYIYASYGYIMYMIIVPHACFEHSVLLLHHQPFCARRVRYRTLSVSSTWPYRNTYLALRQHTIQRRHCIPTSPAKQNILFVSIIYRYKLIDR
jgi:hypothetical protein